MGSYNPSFDTRCLRSQTHPRSSDPSHGWRESLTNAETNGTSEQINQLSVTAELTTCGRSGLSQILHVRAVVDESILDRRLFHCSKKDSRHNIRLINWFVENSATIQSIDIVPNVLHSGTCIWQFWASWHSRDRRKKTKTFE